MITQLTKEQEEKMKEYVDMYIQKGLATDRIDKNQCIIDIDLLYEKVLERKKTSVIILRSPIECWKDINQHLKEVFGDYEGDLNYISPWLQGAFDANIFAFYDFFLQELNINFGIYEEKYKIWRNTIKYGLIFPLNDCCFVSEKPIEINMKNKKLHADMKPALKYEDGFSLYYLNGIKVNEKIVMTPANKLDCHLILTEKNAEIRNQIVKKIGIDRILQDLNAKSIDQKEVIINNNKEYLSNMDIFQKLIKYELLLLDLGDGRKRPYLRMENPSTNEIHIEGVAPEIKTVDEALQYRIQKKESAMPIVLT